MDALGMTLLYYFALKTRIGFQKSWRTADANCSTVFEPFAAYIYIYIYTYWLYWVYWRKQTLWEPGYDIFVLWFRPKTSSCQLPYQRPSYIFVLWFRPKTSSCQLPYQRPSSCADCARELFKGSNGLDSLLDCTWKKSFWVGVADFFVS